MEAALVSIRQIRSVVAVVEEGSFTRAAQRENATQSGVSQHVSAVERELGVALFERNTEGVRPTPVGARYYDRCLEVLRSLETANSEAKAAGKAVSGRLRAGLMPAFTRAALPPALERYTEAYPAVEIEIVEGYSGTLTDMVRAEELDLALVPAFSGSVGLTVKHLIRDREMLLSGRALELEHGAPVRLADLAPLNVIVPTPGNVRRRKLEEYFETHGVRIAKIMEMDAMLGTLGLVARTDWVTVLPEVICVADRDGRTRRVSPIVDPALYSDFVTIEPSRRPLAPPGHLFLEEIRKEVAALTGC